jgi:hypothetical protein
MSCFVLCSTAHANNVYDLSNSGFTYSGTDYSAVLYYEEQDGAFHPVTDVWSTSNNHNIDCGLYSISAISDATIWYEDGDKTNVESLITSYGFSWTCDDYSDSLFVYSSLTYTYQGNPVGWTAIGVDPPTLAAPVPPPVAVLYNLSNSCFTYGGTDYVDWGSQYYNSISGVLTLYNIPWNLSGVNIDCGLYSISGQGYATFWYEDGKQVALESYLTGLGDTFVCDASSNDLFTFSGGVYSYQGDPSGWVVTGGYTNPPMLLKNLIPPAGGGGTIGNPYIITDIYQFQDIEMNLSAYYELGNNIDASSTIGWNAGQGFCPIGSADDGIGIYGNFTGSLDGAGYLVGSLYENWPNYYSAGVFDSIGASGGVKNTLFNNSYIMCGADGKVGGMCVTNYGMVDNVSIFGGIIGNYETMPSGFCVYNYGTLNNSHASDYVSRLAGGIVGGGSSGFCSVNYNNITNCYFDGTVEDFGGVGSVGFCAYNFGNISKCFGLGNILSASTQSYGFCGINYNNISNCYAVTNISSSGTSAGFCELELGGSIINCYAAGSIASTNGYGFCCSQGGGSITSSYWDMQSTGQSTSNGGSGKTTTQMMQQATFVNWDFASPVWSIFEGVTYPLLGNYSTGGLTPPTNFVATVISNSQIMLTWINGSGPLTMVRMSPIGYPANVSSGILLYNGSLEVYNCSGLVLEKTYYFRAWSESSDGTQFSTYYADISAIIHSGVYVASSSQVVNFSIPGWYGNGSCNNIPNVPMRDIFINAANSIGCCPLVLVEAVAIALAMAISVSIFLFSGSIMFGSLVGLIILIGAYWSADLPIWIMLTYALVSISLYFVLRRA